MNERQARTTLKRRPRLAHLMSTSPPVVVTHYTDPWSVWCWALEPQLLRLRERHAGRIHFQVRLGAILETPVPVDFPRQEIARMFAAARRQSSMPLDPDVVLRKGSGTTSRAGIAAKAAQLVAPERFEAYLRRLRLAALVDGIDIEELAAQERLATECGIDASAFREAVETDEATREFYGDQAEGRLKGVTGFPTVTFRGREGTEVAVSGFSPTEAFEAALLRITGARQVDEPPPDLHDLLARRGPLATVEVAETLDLLEDVATTRLLELETSGKAKRELRAGGYFWRAA